MKILWINRRIIKTKIRQEIIDRYRGSRLGLLWSILHPILMLVVYTFVFNIVFQSKWGDSGQSKGEFALILFCGLIAYNIFADCVSRAPELITKNECYVKKKNFPLEVFPVITVGSSLVHGLISLFVLVIGVAC
ncbi:hypothetical protein N752_19275 [Desulforamulus aquiferis]|nr:ABC transporter permease [Desulforamulus aquiferis]RYD03550.1 hypothetical protein N752_19275 [Desulforamulus aquiferis]